MSRDSPHPALSSFPWFALLALSLWLPASQASEDLSAEDIAAAVGDRTYQGSMTDDAFSEYYATDGTLRGRNYAGTWRAEDGALCFTYGEGDEECWDVLLNGPSMTLVKNGEVDGSGMLIDGNPNDF